MIEPNFVDYKNINDLNSKSQAYYNNTNKNITKTKKDINDNSELSIHIDEKKKESQHKLIIDDIEIYFPYEPYKIQEIYMRKIIETLNKKYLSDISNTSKDKEFNSIAALESPTGTGKTLCLLCSTLGWVHTMRKRRKYLGNIFYTTRTHSQISQVIYELNKTCYVPKIAILSSREFSCINTELKKSFNSTVLDIKCAKEHRKCIFYKGSEFYSNLELGCVDIEEIVKIGKAKMFCPFYAERMKVKKRKCDLIFMPYNYIFQKEIRNTMDINLNNNVLIIDEAHNVTYNCEEAKSVEVNYKDFEEMVSDLKEIIKERNKNNNFKITELNKKDENSSVEEKEEKEEEDKENEENQEDNNPKENIYYLRIDCLLKEIDAIKNIMNNLKLKKQEISEKNIYPNKNYIEIDSKDFLSIFLTSEEKITELKKIESKNQKTIDYFFNKANSENEGEYDEINKLSIYITENNIKKHIYFINRIIKAILQDYSRKTKLSKLLNILEQIKDYLENNYIINSYVSCLSDEKVQNNHNISKKIIKLNIFCFNPGIGFKDIIKAKPYSIIFTSGTLAPFDILEDELKIKFDTTLENEHIIDKTQYKFSIIKGYNVQKKNLVFNFEYNNRNDLKTIASLGITILNLCKSVKSGGILVYFTSFKYLNDCYSIWGDSNIILEISKIKTIFFDNKKNKNLISDYKKTENKNSILFSVFRGTSSEGIDFKDDFARMVICVGVPYASIVEEKVQLKIKYLDKINKEGGSSLTGRKWYLNDAISNVNQTLGRVLRHRNDYGALICIDERYEFHYKSKLFSKWIRDNCEIINILDDNFIKSLEDFFTAQDKRFNEENNKNTIKENENENIINKSEDKSLSISINEEENSITNNNDEDKKNSLFLDKVFKKNKKEIKYGYEEEIDIFNNNNLNNNNINTNNNEIKKEEIDSIINKYYKNSNTDSNTDYLNKKTKPKIDFDNIKENEMNYNNEDINPNQLKIKEKKDIIKDKNKILANEQLKKKEINNKNKEEDFDKLFEEMDNYKYDSKINDLNNIKIKDMLIDLDNNKSVKISDEEILFCSVCYEFSNKNPNLQYSQSKCKHILCNNCWAQTLYEKLECPLCKKKARMKTLTRLIKKTI